jgi:hypothetical protein
MLLKTHRMIALCSTANFINAADRIIMPIAIIPMTDQFKWFDISFSFLLLFINN